MRAFTFTDQYESEALRYSGKMIISLFIIRSALAVGDKVVVFSQSLHTISLLERMLHRDLGYARETLFAWHLLSLLSGARRFQKNLDFFTLIGQTKADIRQDNINLFNDRTSRAKIFLVSTAVHQLPCRWSSDSTLPLALQAGSLGVNMTGANRMILFDASWNPAQDQQAIFRCYRYGQQKTVFVYRLVAEGAQQAGT